MSKKDEDLYTVRFIGLLICYYERECEEMGNVIRSIHFNSEILNKINNPIIFCTHENKVLQLVEDYTKIYINVLLAEELIKLAPKKRGVMVADTFIKILSNFSGKVILADFEMLFNPDYPIDIIKLFVEEARKRKIVALWPGKYDGDRLLYSVPELSDFHSFTIANYNIVCVI